MTRYYKGKPIELLAPAGTFDIFKSVIHTNCDAVYFGGRYLNMRMIRKGYNFSNDEIKEAIAIAHTLNKKVYITVNNLLNHEDLTVAEEYLKFLDEVQPDALIIQDFAIVELIRKLDLSLELHSSVMMNVHNIATIEALKDYGITRVVASREMSLETVHQLIEKTGMEFEYFTHGDMCVSHGAQCLYSGMLFGMSSNRGRCLKPCRWPFQMKSKGLLYEESFPLAVKDMCLYEHLPELLNSGVSSFKIEGRMRDKDFITKLVNLYGDAIDTYIKNPTSYNSDAGFKTIFDTRKRDLSTGYAFGNPGIKNNNTRYEGTGKFYSTGKMFSTPTEEKEITNERIKAIQSTLSDCRVKKSSNSLARPQLAVKVNNMTQALLCLEKNVDYLYLSGDVFEPDSPFTREMIHQLLKLKRNTKIYLALPKMMMEEDFLHFDQLLINEQIPVDGVLCTSLGTLNHYRHLGYELALDSSANVYNHLAAKYYENAGAQRVTLSLELPLLPLKDLLSNSSVPLEIIVHAKPTVIYMDHNLHENLQTLKPVSHDTESPVDDQLLLLKTPAGEYPVYVDQHGRNHMTTSKDLCYLAISKELANAGINTLRIHGCTYDKETLEKLIDAYTMGFTSKDYDNTTLPLNHNGYTLGPLAFD